jgi:hypothetical protein
VQGEFIYGRDTSTNLLNVTPKQFSGSWFVQTWVTDTFTGTPGAANTSDYCDAVFVRKSNGQVAHAMFDYDSGLGACVYYAGSLVVVNSSPAYSGSPVASSSWSGSNHRFDVFVRDGSGNIASTTGTGTKHALSWTSWTSDTAITISTDPAVAALGGRIDLVACDTSGALKHKVYSGGAWGSWSTAIASGCTSSPSVVATLTKQGYTQLVVATRASTGDYQTLSYVSGGFGAGWGTSWTSLGGSFTSPPSLQLRSGGKRIWGHNLTSGIMFGDF